VKVKWPEAVLRWKGALGKYQYVLLVMAVGILLLLLPAGDRGEAGGAEKPAVQEDGFDLDAFEKKLEQALSQIEGAGKARVVLTLDSGSRRVLAQNQDQDGEGGMTRETVTVGQGSGSQGVVPLQTLAPRFRGALVVCPGGGSPQVRLQLAEAVSALTGLGADRISICPGSGS